MGIQHRLGKKALAAIFASLGTVCAAAQPETGVSELDYFEELPVVLSVSRLAQPLDETPGAVTVIDREMIRRSGARELAEVMRLVPGFLVSQRNGANPFVSYHGDFDSINRRLQVFVDGRSVYSSFYAGDVHHGMMGVILEDIERIEVLRGSNSAAYGANALMGVINIVTRNAADTKGAMLSLTGGDKGIDDNVVRLGWGSDQAAFRVSVARRSDNGLDNQYDDKHVSQAHLRGDLKLSERDELALHAGSITESLGDGFLGATSDVARTTIWRNFYTHGTWRRELGGGEHIQASASYDDEIYTDRYIATQGVLTAPISTSGRGSRFGMQAQHSFTPAAGLRMVWGGEYRREQVLSEPLFASTNTLSSHLWRVFGNVEWRPHAQWIVNAGGLFEHQSLSGNKTSPRLMVNYHVLPGHTLRAGTTEAHRLPTIFEMRGDIRWHTYVGQIPFGIIQKVLATGQAKPETLTANEIGYLGEFRSLGLTADVRGFEENMDRGVLAYDGTPSDVILKRPNRRRGWETQLRWQPASGSQIILNHAVIRVEATSLSDERAAPSHMSSLAWFQRLPLDFDFGLIYTKAGPVTMTTTPEALDASHQLDLRLARSFRIGTTKCEAAIFVQAIDGEHQEYQDFKHFRRRAYATLRLDF